MTFLDRDSPMLSRVRMWIFSVSAGLFLVAGWGEYFPGFVPRLIAILQLIAAPACLYGAWREFRRGRHAKRESHASSQVPRPVLFVETTERRRSASVAGKS